MTQLERNRDRCSWDRLGLLLSPTVSIIFSLNTKQKKHKKGQEQQRQKMQILVVVGKDLQNPGRKGDFRWSGVCGSGELGMTLF